MHNSVAASSYLMSYYRAHPDELRSVDGRPRAFTTATLSGQTNGLLEEPAEMRRAETSPTSKLLSAQPHNVLMFKRFSWGIPHHLLLRTVFASNLMRS
jgi:hypothetical protein